jgi:hypothetical protein
MAGATAMRARAFFFFAGLGTVLKVTAVYFLGDALAAPLRDVADLVARYQWYLTGLSFAIVLVQLARRRTRGAIPIESVDELERELGGVAGAAAAVAEPTVSPPSTTQA